jgi:hypothetical protein
MGNSPEQILNNMRNKSEKKRKLISSASKLLGYLIVSIALIISILSVKGLSEFISLKAIATVITAVIAVSAFAGVMVGLKKSLSGQPIKRFLISLASLLAVVLVTYLVVDVYLW